MKIIKTALVALLLMVGITLVPSQSANAAEIGPYNTWRWDTPGTGAHICVDNRSQFPVQTATEQWNLANDLVLVYEGSGNCAGWAENEKIDVFNGTDSSKPCAYHWGQYGSGNTVANMNVYLNTAHGANCWGSSVRTNHFVSQGLGVALGLLNFSGTPPSYVSVMRNESIDTVSWPQAGDRNTFDWYN
jgi:hypothetical protein